MAVWVELVRVIARCWLPMGGAPSYFVGENLEEICCAKILKKYVVCNGPEQKSFYSIEAPATDTIAEKKRVGLCGAHFEDAFSWRTVRVLPPYALAF